MRYRGLQLTQYNISLISFREKVIISFGKVGWNLSYLIEAGRATYFYGNIILHEQSRMLFFRIIK